MAVTTPDQHPALELRAPAGLADRTFRLLALGAGCLVLVILALIAVSTIRQSGDWFTTEGVSTVASSDWNPAQGRYGALAFIYGTLLSSTIALVLAVPVSLAIALLITQVAPARLRQPIIYVLDLLAVIPSVVYGLWGIIVLAPRLVDVYGNVQDALGGVPLVGALVGGTPNGKAFMTAGIILALMVTPIITSLAREVIDTTPPGEREAAYALGATRWEMIRGAVWPHSKAGVVGAVMLGLGRAMGETIAAALVIGSSAQVTAHLFSPGDSMPAVIANQFGEAIGLQRSALIGLGVVLFAVTIVVNMAARTIVERSVRAGRGA